MKNKKKMTILIVVVFLLLIIFLIKLPKNYTKKYSVGKFDVVEKYNSKTKAYSFLINNKYEYSIKHKYKGKKLIKEIKYLKGTEKRCIDITGKKIEYYPLCYDNYQYSYTLEKAGQKLIDSKTSNSSEKIKVKKYNNITIDNIHDKNIFIWNHKGYYMINNKENKNIDFLDNEYYFNDTAFKTYKYLVTPDYKQKYEFDKFYVTNLETGKTKEMKLKDKISYNFYYLGDYKKKSFIIDRKNEREYVLKLKRRKIRDITSKEDSGIIYDNKFKEVSMTKLVNTDYTFNKSEAYTYKVEKKKLYLNYYNGNNDILLTNKKIDKLISYDDEFVYYLINDTIYAYSNKYGEQKMITFSELDFNSNNQIFIY